MKNKKYILTGIGIFLIILIFFIGFKFIGNKSLEECSYINKSFEVYSCEKFKEIENNFILIIANNSNPSCNNNEEDNVGGERANIKCLEKENKINIKIPRDNSNLTLLKIDTKEYSQSNDQILHGQIKEELYGLVEIEKYFQKEYSYDCQREINYLFTSYSDYGRKISSELEEKIGIENLGVYGGEEAKYCGKIYFLMYKHGEWDSVRYWAIEIDAETGELLEWKEVTKGT